MSLTNGPTLTLIELTEYLKSLPEDKKTEIDQFLSQHSPTWVPTQGPQTAALNTEADVLFYGGSAGGGKTDLLIGLALTQHHASLLMRREGTQFKGINRRIRDLLGSRDDYNTQLRTWSPGKRVIELGSCPHAGDEEDHQGIPHDLLGFDEITHFSREQFEYLQTWVRSTDPNQRCRIVATGNPPRDSDGEWVIQYWAPWLDPNHPNPAQPGELRWFATLDGKDAEVAGPEEIEVDGEIIKPKSRTFIPSSVEDNPFLMQTDYKSTLQGLPEPLRSQMLKGDFQAGRGSDPWQVIPTHWVELAMERWSPRYKKPVMDSLGCDVARGDMDKPGGDNTVIACRYGGWFDELKRYPGSDTPRSNITASLIVAELKDSAPIHVDEIGIGSGVFDHLEQNNLHVLGINNAKKSEKRDRTGKLSFANVRAETYWKLREALDPETGDGLAIPPDPKLKADLCAPRWQLTARGILVESKVEIKKRLGRSTDDGDAVVLANIRTPKRETEAEAYEETYHGEYGWMR